MAEADPFPIHQDAAEAARERAAATRRKRVRLVLMTIVPALIVGAGLWYWFGSPGEVDTDNAYVK